MSNVHGFRPYKPPAAAAASRADGGAAAVLHVEPSLAELSAYERVQLVRPYAAAGLLALAALVALVCVYQLVQHARRDTVPDRSARPAHRPSRRLGDRKHE